jgi:predicted transposase YbfD/YdcC
MGQEKTFCAELQNCKAIDLRDNRGKRHKIWLVLLGLTLGLLRKRDGNLSSLHRSMVNTHDDLCNFLGVEKEGVISRSQLPILLQKVKLECFEKLLFKHYGIELSEEEKSWFSGDGKELRGSIETGDKRGTAIVQLVRQSDKAVLGQSFYEGKKESEKPTLRNLIKETGAASEKITTDALHLNPEMTELIAGAGGIFMIGLKENQKELLADMRKDASFLKPVNQLVTIDKGHGRIDRRTYFHYDVGWEYFDERWSKSNFQSLFKIIRERYDLTTHKTSTETAFYISNGKYDKSEDYFGALREHWAVEVNNHIRDVTLNEDNLRTKKRV